MILIADAHINSNRTTTHDFFQMLERISETAYDVVFLGDIFELWIALDRYEDDNHRRFLSWCRREKQTRSVGYVEGNHEFFLALEHSDCFTWCEPRFKHLEEKRLGFCHGDMINADDWKYRLFRILTKNRAAKFLVEYMPLAPRAVRVIKEKMTNTNKERGYMPKDSVTRYADNTLCDTLPRIFTGHFHVDFSYGKNEFSFYSLPDWMATGKITVYDEISGDVNSMHWSSL